MSQAYTNDRPLLKRCHGCGGSLVCAIPMDWILSIHNSRTATDSLKQVLPILNRTTDSLQHSLQMIELNIHL